MGWRLPCWFYRALGTARARSAASAEPGQVFSSAFQAASPFWGRSTVRWCRESCCPAVVFPPRLRAAQAPAPPIHPPAALAGGAAVAAWRRAHGRPGRRIRGAGSELCCSFLFPLRSPPLQLSAQIYRPFVLLLLSHPSNHPWVLHPFRCRWLLMFQTGIWWPACLPRSSSISRYSPWQQFLRDSRV